VRSVCIKPVKSRFPSKERTIIKAESALQEFCKNKDVPSHVLFYALVFARLL
jgi:hypothetical protein